MTEHEPAAKRLKCTEEDTSQQRKNDLQLISATENKRFIIPQPKTKVPLEFMDLNDDCFLAILNHMKLSELENIAKTCMRLQDVTQYQFRLKYKYFDFKNLAEGQTVQYLEARDVLQSFGNRIATLKLSSHLFPSMRLVHFILIHISRSCLEMLRELSLNGCEIPLFVFDAMSSLWPLLEKLELADCTINMTRGNFSHLKVLKLSGLEVEQQQKLPMLEELYLNSCQSKIGVLSALIELHPRLKRISIIDHIGASESFFTAIGQSFDRLEYIEANIRVPVTQQGFESAMKHLASIRTLKVIKLHCNLHSMTHFFAELINNQIKIENLHLSFGFFDSKAWSYLAHMDNLKILELNEMMLDDGSEFYQMLANIPSKLQQFRIKISEVIDAVAIKILLRKAVNLFAFEVNSLELTLNSETYDDMLAIIKRRPRPVILEMTIYGNGQQVFVPAWKIKENVKTLDIKQLKSENHFIFPKNVFDILETDFEIESESSDGEFAFIEDGDISDQESDHGNEVDNNLNMIYGIKVNEKDEPDSDDNFAVEELPDFRDEDIFLMDL